MHAAALPLPPATWAARPAAAQALILTLLAQVVALQTEVAALHTPRRELQARLGQDSCNCSRAWRVEAAADAPEGRDD
jgi:hypothetical protein